MNNQEELELEQLNLKVNNAIKERKEWLDLKMMKYSELKVGDDLYNINTGKKLGVITNIYRYWRDRDEGVRDTSLDFFYEYKVEEGYYDNSSRKSFWVGTKEQAIAKKENDLARLKE